ncbi:uncharacterized protein A1O9_12200 [Exophiala aquamarina CBS 119918]|uniref:Branched-chain amino acid aminotransferase n=1 Tax=Exophiala aquamarina CBS 119918 TaxID=1182545 RepID=A0A072NWR0_9EURO|nr:uncharacterized protein A1O9_12200 [Exophiala aquamarina CBS 119918]KEF51862.1 hypothetical protein A1O9_12200 [Exophiala aquamarina CBS 119918]
MAARTMEDMIAAYRQRKAELEKGADNAFAKGVAWVEGSLVPLHEARIPLLDQGFLHSDLTYDVPAVWDGRYFRLDDHLSRLETSCGKLRLRFPLPREEIRRILIDMVAQSGIRDAYVEIIVSRGFTSVREARLGDTSQNNLYMFVMPYVWVMEPEEHAKGGAAVITRTVRRTPPGSMDPTIKNLQWGDLTRGIFEAADRNSTYPILTDGDAHITEGAGYNIVLVKDGVIYTPDRGVLEGVTRKSVMDVAKANGIQVHLQVVPVELAYSCDEIFMCTTAGGIMPITSLDGQPVKDGKVGPVTIKIWHGYWALHYDPVYSFAVDYVDPDGAGAGTAKGVTKACL